MLTPYWQKSGSGLDTSCCVVCIYGKRTRDKTTPSEEVLELDDFFLGPKPSLFPRRGRAHVASLHRPTLGGPELDLTTLKARLDLAKQRRENTRTQPCCQGDRRSPSCRLPTTDCRLPLCHDGATTTKPAEMADHRSGIRYAADATACTRSWTICDVNLNCNGARSSFNDTGDIANVDSKRDAA